MIFLNPVLVECTFDEDEPELDKVLMRNASAQEMAVEASLCLIAIRKFCRNEHLFFQVPKELVLLIAKDVCASKYDPVWWR
jgi:hypothetical protein